MNKVKLQDNQDEESEYTGDELRKLLLEGKTAFIGEIGSHYGLFLINYTCIVEAAHPDMTWITGHFNVERFVDVEITVR